MFKGLLAQFTKELLKVKNEKRAPTRHYLPPTAYKLTLEQKIKAKSVKPQESGTVYIYNRKTKNKKKEIH